MSFLRVAGLEATHHIGHFRVIGPVRHHDGRCPSVGLEIEAHGASVLAVSAQDEDRTPGMMQVIDLGSHVNRERGDYGRGQQHASACSSDRRTHRLRREVTAGGAVLASVGVRHICVSYRSAWELGAVNDMTMSLL